MRLLSVFIPLSLLLLAAGSAAQTQPYPRPDTAPIPSVTVTGQPRSVRLMPDEVQQIAGTYDMANGWRMVVRGKPEYIDATIDAQQPLRLKPVSRHKFISGDGNVIIEFSQDTSEDLKLSYVPDPSKPSMVSIPAQKARR